jgi:hypothetical protein
VDGTVFPAASRGQLPFHLLLESADEEQMQRLVLPVLYPEITIHTVQVRQLSEHLFCK